MECGICQRHLGARRKAVCASCAKASLYKPRVEQIQARLANEKAHTQVEAIVRPGNDGVLAALPGDADWDAITAGIRTQSHRRALAEKTAVDLRIDGISGKARELRQQIEEHKSYIAKQKQLHKSRRDVLEIEREKLAARRSEEIETVKQDIEKAKRRLKREHARTALSRDCLCKTVAWLCGLQRVRDKNGRSQFYLAGLPIPNLKDLNCLNGRIRCDRISALGGQPVGEPQEVVSASLDNVCLFVGLCCHYLSVRLPAEIVLPTNNFPHSALMQRDASYKAGELYYPGIGSASASPSQSRTLSSDGERRRPRVLQLHKPLPQLQKQDHKTHGSFVEGAMLLAYDIAWLCRSQGVTEGTPSFDDVCDIGRNLYFLAGPKFKSSERRPATATNHRDEPAAEETPLGHFSHGSVAHSLPGHEGTAMFAPDVWKVSLTTWTDKLKHYLRNEAARSEWEIIDDTEWDNVLEHEQAVMVGGASVVRRPDMSVMTVAPHDGADESSDAPAPEKGKAKDASGWTKLRGRGGDA